jgi:hypothetical protein
MKTGWRFLARSPLGGCARARKLDEVLRIGVGLRLVLERTDVEMWPRSKPRTTLWWLRSVFVLASEPTGGLMGSLPWAVATVDDDDSGMRRAVVGGEAGRGVQTSAGLRCSATGAASFGGSGDSGSRNFFSWMLLTTFSRPMGVMWRPRALLVAESWRRRSGREAVESERELVMALSMRLESSEATLDESSGISAGSCCSKDHCGDAVSGMQQNVSRDHRRHAMFSYRLPSSIAGEHRAKTGDVSTAACTEPRWIHTGPEAEQVLRVACLDSAHRAVLDTHNRALSVERHPETGRGRAVCGGGGGLGVGVGVEVERPLASVTARWACG